MSHRQLFAQMDAKLKRGVDIEHNNAIIIAQRTYNNCRGKLCRRLYR